ncbi:MAG: arsenite methyltransferase [Rhodospirillaceae bacterium]|nr:arsenite methyltransferase [Rhodospirillaceae bacterium]
MSDTATSENTSDDIRKTVRDSYATIVTKGGNSGCCAPVVSVACGGDENAPADTMAPEEFSRRFGYSDEEMNAVPEGANMGLGCGNPSAIAALKAGETVVDLGSGGGFDCFLAARQVGNSGHVIGIDMTHEMLAMARKNAEKTGHKNVEFRLGEIEHLPVADNTADVIISNCVINLSPDKPQVIAEAFRVLKPGGRLAISDIVATADFPDEIANDKHLLSGCVAGATPVVDLEKWMTDSGFGDIRIDIKEESRDTIGEWSPGRSLGDYVASASIEAIKPGGDKKGCC